MVVADEADDTPILLRPEEGKGTDRFSRRLCA